MSAIRDALVQYVAVRRALGTKFREPALTLEHFVDFLEREESRFANSKNVRVTCIIILINFFSPFVTFHLGCEQCAPAFIPL